MIIIARCKECENQVVLEWKSLTIGSNTPISKERDVVESVERYCPFCNNLISVDIDIRLLVTNHGVKEC